MVRMVVLGGLVFIVLVIDPSFEGSDPAEDSRFLRAIKSTARLFTAC
jgi:hypothetical protein